MYINQPDLTIYLVCGTPTEPAINKEEEYLYTNTSMAHALESDNKSMRCVEPQLLKSCLNFMNTEKEPEKCSLMAVICETFSCKKYSNKSPNELNKHVHFRLFSDDHVGMRRPTSFPDFNCQFTFSYILVTDTCDELFHHVAVPI